MPAMPDGGSSCVTVAACGWPKTPLPFVAMISRAQGESRSLGCASGRQDAGKICLGRPGATNTLLLLPAHAGWWLLDTRGEVTWCLLLEWRHDLRARRIARRVLAARMKDTARRRIRWRGNIAGEQDSLAL